MKFYMPDMKVDIGNMQKDILYIDRDMLIYEK